MTHFIEARGFWLLALDVLDIDGLTMPWKRVYLRPEFWWDKGLRAHELAHIAQINRLGPVRFSITYLWQLFRYGYERMPLELEANEIQRQVDES